MWANEIISLKAERRRVIQFRLKEVAQNVRFADVRNRCDLDIGLVLSQLIDHSTNLTKAHQAQFDSGMASYLIHGGSLFEKKESLGLVRKSARSSPTI